MKIREIEMQRTQRHRQLYNRHCNCRFFIQHAESKGSQRAAIMLAERYAKQVVCSHMSHVNSMRAIQNLAWKGRRID